LYGVRSSRVDAFALGVWDSHARLPRLR